jgi:hypothetical protein
MLNPRHRLRLGALLLVMFVGSLLAPLADTAAADDGFDSSRSTTLIDWNRLTIGNPCNEQNAAVSSDLRDPQALHDWFAWIDDHAREDPAWRDFLGGQWDGMQQSELDRMAEELITAGESAAIGLEFEAQPDGLGVQNVVPLFWKKIPRKASKHDMVSVKITNAFSPREGSDYGRHDPGHNYSMLVGKGEHTTLEVLFDLYGPERRLGISFIERDVNHGLMHFWGWVQTLTGEDPPEIVDIRLFPTGLPTVGSHQPPDRLAERDWLRAHLLDEDVTPGAWDTGRAHWSGWGLTNLTAEPEPAADCVRGPATVTSAAAGAQGDRPSAPDSMGQDMLATAVVTSSLASVPTDVQLVWVEGMGVTLRTTDADRPPLVLEEAGEWNESEQEEVQEWLEELQTPAEQDEPRRPDSENVTTLDIADQTRHEPATTTSPEADTDLSVEHTFASPMGLRGPPVAPEAPSMLPLGFAAWLLVTCVPFAVRRLLRFRR